MSHPNVYVLGLDLGTNSLGWAIIALVDGESHQLVRAGVRAFDAGMDETGGLGNEESRNKARRDARLQRRQMWRRARRLKKIFNLLQRGGLLPPGDASASDKRQDRINELDKSIGASDGFKAKAASGLYNEPAQTMPYILRAAALDEPIEPYFLGRALYHLAQRRGFLSNRKQVSKKRDDEGAVKEGITELRRLMKEANARTLGEYFSSLAPSEHRIRSRWTARDMYEAEFEKIWEAQAAHHPSLLTPELKKELYNAVFYQRPMWFDPDAVGPCELEPSERRAPAYLLISQRFRLLQTVNNLKVIPPDDLEMPLSAADRQKLIETLETQGDLEFSKVRKLLGLTKEYKFNLEQGGEKKPKGNRTGADFYDALGHPWLQMTPAEQNRLVQYVYAFEKPDKLIEAAQKKWNLSRESAAKLAGIKFEADYMHLSQKAMEKLLPWLEQGLTYGEARKKVYHESFLSGQPRELLPPVVEALPEVRNPAVMRSLSELRKVVNTIARQYGKPQEIRIELARELKKPKKAREAISKANRRNEEARAQAARKIFEEMGIKDPKPDDIRKVLLAEECHWTCPYTGKPISMESLLGPEPQFDIEHIIPFSRSMDSSFQNLTLSQIRENREVKRNQTPHQAYSGDPKKYEDILDRVEKFAGDRATRAAKLRRFKMNDKELEYFLEDFRSRQLNDTAYASRLAKRYLGLFYDSEVDPEGKRRVQATSGQTTFYFRNLWKLNSILNDGPTTDGGYKQKSRDDHRHHAVDAVVIGLTDAGMVKRLSDAAQRAPQEGRKRFASLESPWPNFVESVRAEIDKIVVSHRVSKKVSGALHEETTYSPPRADGSVRVRKALNTLSKNEVEEIADPKVKELVLKKLVEIGGDPKKFPAPTEQENLDRFPCFVTKDGRRILIKRVRIKKAVPTLALGKGRSARYVKLGSNHHVEIYAELDENGNEGKWDGEVVSMYEAYQRVKAGKPVVQRDHGPLVKFKLSLASGEVIECDGETDKRRLLVVRSFSEFSNGWVEINLVKLTDARKKAEAVKAKEFLRIGPDKLRQWRTRKVAVSPIGEISDASD